MQYKHMDLKDKVVLITGGSSGLGKALALALIQEGAKVIITARNTEQLEKVGNEIEAIPITLDVTKEEQVINKTREIVKRFGKIDIWINNAGIWLPHAPIEEMDMQRVHEMVDVNLFGTIYGSKAALIQMREQKSGVIINILSTSALTGRAHSAGYCASKYAATGFTNSLRLEAENDGIDVVSVYPGGMQTNFFDECKPGNYDQYMDPSYVAEKVVANLKSEKIESEQIIKRS